MKFSKDITPASFSASISKEAMENLPKATYPGKIHLIDNLANVNKAIEILSQEPGVIGFDTETRPSFQKGIQYDVALLQLSTATDCFLFRLNLIGIPPALNDLLSNPNIIKVGLSVHDDIRGLKRKGKFDPQGFVELQRLCPAYGIKDASLQKIYAIVYGEKMSKGQRLTNWEAKELTLQQQTYAALDAWASLRIFLRIMEQPHPSPIQFALL